MIDVDFVARIVEHANRPDSRDHGEQHWKAVAWTGQQLCRAVPDADPLVAFLFALFHDTRRENEYDDPFHGMRGAAFATLSLDERSATLQQMVQLTVAISGHDEGQVSDDPTIGVCWDSDRLQLWRVGIVPDPALLSTDAARELLPSSSDIWRGSYSWATILRDVPRGEQ